MFLWRNITSYRIRPVHFQVQSLLPTQSVRSTSWKSEMYILQQSQSIFNVKMDGTFSIEEINLEMIKTIQYKLQTILNVEPVQLVDVEDGCIKLTFRYFKQTRLFPLGEAQKAGLTEIGVQWLCCGEDKELLMKKHLSVKDYIDPSCSICASLINPAAASNLSGMAYIIATVETPL